DTVEHVPETILALLERSVGTEPGLGTAGLPESKHGRGGEKLLGHAAKPRLRRFGLRQNVARYGTVRDNLPAPVFELKAPEARSLGGSFGARRDRDVPWVIGDADARRPVVPFEVIDRPGGGDGDPRD